MATMKEISKLVGVSQATVSRVLSGSSSVSPMTRQKVMEVVQKLDYRPSYSAQVLVKKQSFLIGLILPDIANPFLGEIVRQVDREASRNGYSLILSNSDGDQIKERTQLQILRARQVDGMLVVPASSESTILTTLRHSDIPSVIITQTHDAFDSVYISHEAGGRLVAQHLLSLGHTRVLLVGDNEEENEKFKGFRELFIEKGIELPAEHFLNIGTWEHNVTQRTYTAALAYFQHHGNDHVSAVFAVNDLAAFGVMHALKELKITIPQQVALVGFDDTFLAQGTNPTLTSIAQPVEEIGRVAIELLIDRLIRGIEGEPRHVRLEPLLVTRGSTIAG